MRKVTFGVASSLDGFIARRDHGVDWLRWDDEVAAITADFWKTIDTVVMGRLTYEVAAASGTPSYPGVKNYLVSRTLASSPHPEVELVATDPGDFIRRLKAEEGSGICVMGGGVLARSLFEADVIDEVGLSVQPVLLGAGIPLFHPISRQIELELLECRRLGNGCALLRYAVVR